VISVLCSRVLAWRRLLYTTFNVNYVVSSNSSHDDEASDSEYIIILQQAITDQCAVFIIIIIIMALTLIGVFPHPHMCHKTTIKL